VNPRTGWKDKVRYASLRLGLGATWLSWLGLILNPRKIRTQWDLYQDYAATRRQVGAFAARGGEMADHRRRVLLLSLSPDFLQFKVELLMAKALQFKGYDIVVAASRTNIRHLKYFRLFGVKNFVFIEDMRRNASGASAPSGKEFEPPYTFGRLMSLTARGVNIGQHALSTYLAFFQKSKLNIDAPEVTDFLRRTLRQALSDIPAVEKLLDKVKPEIILFLEKGYLPNAIFFDLALQRGMNAIQWCGAQETDAYVLKKYTLDNRKTHPFSLSPESWRAARGMPWTEEMNHEFERMLADRYEKDTWYNRNRLRPKVTIRPAEEVRAMLGLDSTKKTAVVFSHILWDATFFYGNNLFEDYEKWLMATVRAACANPAVNWVIKLHPDYVWKLKRGGGTLEEPDLLAQTFGRLPPHVKLMLPDTDINTYSLFGVTDVCVTVRGTIGIEMACHGVPVLTAGDGRYSHLGFTIDSASAEEYLGRLSAVQSLPKMTPEQIALARKFAYALFKLRPFRFQSIRCSFKDMPDIKHPLFVNGRYALNSEQDLLTAADIRAFADWAVDRSRTDYLQWPAAPAVAAAPAAARG